MAAKLTRLTHKIAIELNLVAGIFIICSPRSRRPVRKLLDTPAYNHDTRIEVCTVMIQEAVFWVLTPCCGVVSRVVPRNVGIIPHPCTESQPRRPRILLSVPA